MAEPRSGFVRTVALGVRFVVPTVPMRVSTPINPTRLHHGGRRQRAADGANFDLRMREKELSYDEG